ncbi:MAG: NADPH-dependent 7-cyano-7-deazaguanine reductase QueF [Rhodocyclaceae bacterium]
MSIDSSPEALASPLGKATRYRSDYAPELLFPIPRAGKRAEIGITDSVPFVGDDLWNAYELSWLNTRGKPVVAIGEFLVPASTSHLIESKSLKLYLNSLNQTRFADIADVEAVIARDLSAAAQGQASVRLAPVAGTQRTLRHPDGVCIDDLDIDIDTYQPTPQCLRADAGRPVTDELLYSHLLKSNCLVTGQPDWGMVAIRYSGAAIDREALLRYVVSFREHNEFHEQCVERIFMDLMRHCAPTRLAVWARYTRRGGLDINPFRATDEGMAPGNVGEMRQ